MIFFRIFQHILPDALALTITASKQLREFFEGLTGLGEDIKEFFDLVHEDIAPQTTRELDMWESEFNLKNTGLSDADRRDRLDASWAATGGQSMRYMQDVITANGFAGITLHEWYVPGTQPAVGVKACLVARRDPSSLGGGYPLVNRIGRVSPDELALCGEALAECGEEIADCGFFLDYAKDEPVYILPTDQDKWAYFIYFMSPTFGAPGTVPAERQGEFEALILKMMPAHMWAFILVNYT